MTVIGGEIVYVGEVARSPRSGRQHKAWGVAKRNPRIGNIQEFLAREAGGSVRVISMADIKLTLSKDTTKRAPDIESEARWLEKEGHLYYELHTKPLHASVGCLVYFVRDGKLLARAKASAFRQMTKDELGRSFTGELPDHDGWRVEIKPPMQIASLPIPQIGFQGSRYVTPDERATFQRAFDKKK